MRARLLLSPAPLLLALGALLTWAPAAAGQRHEVLVRFASEGACAKGLAYCEEQAAALRAPKPRHYLFRASGAGHVAVVTSTVSAEEWADRPGVVRVAPEGRLESRANGPDDPGYDEQWHLRQIDAAGAWRHATGGRSATGREVVAAVIEFDGFQLDHPEMEDSWYVNDGEVPGDGIDNDRNGYVDDYRGYNFRDEGGAFRDQAHGVHVTATIGARGDNGQQVTGVNWDVTMLPLQVGSIPQWALAIDYVTVLRERYNATGGAEGAYIVVANMSFGSPRDNCSERPELNAAFERAGNAGILSVGATDNNKGAEVGVTDIPTTCSSDALVVVTATDESDEIWGGSGRDAALVDLGAPGSDYRSVDYVLSGNVTNTFNGTSGATPQVAGVIALMYATDCADLDAASLDAPRETALAIKELLLAGVDDVPQLAGLTLTGGRLNARRAVEGALERFCSGAGMLVAFADDAVAPRRIDDGNVVLELRDTLSAEWNQYAYDVTFGTNTQVVRSLRDYPGVVAAEADVRLLPRGRTPDDPVVAAADFADVLRLPDAWEAVYGRVGNPPRTAVVTAVFDAQFSGNSAMLDGRSYLNDGELADNGVDDDGNGYVDDYALLSFSDAPAVAQLGGHAEGVASIIASPADDGRGSAGVDWAGRLLPVRGQTLAHLGRASSYLADLRHVYNASAGADGALVASLVIAQGGERRMIVNGGLVPLWLDRLVARGILAVAALPNEDVPLGTDFPAGIDHPGLLRVADARTPDAATSPRSTPDLSALQDYVNVQLAEVPWGIDADGEVCSLAGASAASAVVGGTVALLYQVACVAEGDRAYSAPAQLATRIRDAVQFSGTEELATPGINVSQAVRTLSDCDARGVDCRVRVAYPNPSYPGTPVRVVMGATDPGTTECRLRMSNVLGSVIFETAVPIQGGRGSIEVPGGLRSRGTYYLTSDAANRWPATQLLSLE